MFFASKDITTAKQKTDGRAWPSHQATTPRQFTRFLELGMKGGRYLRMYLFCSIECPDTPLDVDSVY